METVGKIMFSLSLFLSLSNGYFISQYPTPKQKAMIPYILDTGESYRDVLTLESSKLVGEIAKRFQFSADHTARKNKEKIKLLEQSQVTPEYQTRRFHKKGILKNDGNIFDFTESRLVNPLPESRQNFPLINYDISEPYLMNSQKSGTSAYGPNIQIANPHKSQ